MDADGELLDPFYGSSVYPTSVNEKLLYKFSIQNLFQVKHLTRTEENPNKVDFQSQKTTILDWGLSTSYKAFADSLNWSPIISRILYCGLDAEAKARTSSPLKDTIYHGSP